VAATLGVNGADLMAMESDVPPIVAAQLAYAERILALSGSSVPRHEAIALLSNLLGLPASLVLAHAESRMSAADVETFADWITRRATGEAIAHITGHLAFMGLDLVVGRDTPLIPPGAERLVETVLERARHHGPGELSAAEIGTGCGAIALALAAFEPRFSRIYALDASARALQVAAANGARYLLNLVINWIQGDGLEAIPDPVDLVVCNWSATVASSLIVSLHQQASARLRPRGALVCGCDDAECSMVVRLLEQTLPGARVWIDSPSDGAVVAVAQLPSRSTGDAAFDSTSTRR
jgi:release factor glutamine methyltransferase